MEKLNLRRMVGVSLVLGLGLTACAEPEPIPEKETTEDTVNNEEDVRIEHFYTPTGKRITSYTSDDSNRVFINGVLSYCDGSDFIDVTDGYGAQSSSIVRTANHPACVDGKLEPEDFKLTEPQS